ncbi:hypothetical protein QYE76_031264 [Lolium multiflorum]|uniref:DUF4219 domain-containing protein n=1 Tax=Lolium multiflorum TaxID=4521 RepID=A0AAD8QRF8_LOLMU|nr:hypothetical protein QYE76_031264 [Lolium multiflorum]
MQESSDDTMNWPTPTKTNYTEWDILMRVQLQGAVLWEAVDTGDAADRLERQGLGAILHSDMIKTMRVSDDHVRKVHRQKLRRDFNNLAFQSGETIEHFSLRVSSVVPELQSLADTTFELDDVQKTCATCQRELHVFRSEMEALEVEVKDPKPTEETQDEPSEMRALSLHQGGSATRWSSGGAGERKGEVERRGEGWRGGRAADWCHPTSMVSSYRHEFY